MCDPGGGFNPDPELRIYGRVYYSSRPFASIHKTPVDTSVVDAESAIAHEFGIHIVPAIRPVVQTIHNLEHKRFKTEAECHGECAKVAAEVAKKYAEALHQTQVKENQQ
jgi:hypothetical protein